MRYDTPRALRHATLARLKRAAEEPGGVEAAHKRVLFERLAARLERADPDRWVLKGGYALQTRLQSARPTRDIDLAFLGDADQAAAALKRAGGTDLSDGFTVELSGTQRWHVTAAIGGRTLTQATADVQAPGLVLADAEVLQTRGELAFADIPPATVRVLSIEQHLAEKVHAYTALHGHRQTPSTRVKDLVDMALIHHTQRVDAALLTDALRQTFLLRADAHPLPDTLPAPPRGWEARWQALARGLPVPRSAADAHRLAARLIDPALAGTATGAWNPALGAWSARAAAPTATPAGCTTRCYRSTTPASGCACACKGKSHGKGASAIPAASPEASILDGTPPRRQSAHTPRV